MQRLVIEEVISKIKEKTIAMFDEKLFSHYVPLQGTKVNQEERMDLAATITKSLDEEQAEVVVLLGDSGAGKSWFGQHLAWQCYQQRSGERIILWIPLLSVEAPQKNLLIKHLRDNLLLAAHEMDILQKSKIPLLIILDGYDELNTKENLFQTNDFGCWGGSNRIQVLLTCRKETLGGDIRGHEQRFWGSKRKIVAYEAAAFDEEQIAAAVKHYVANNEVILSTKEYLKKLKSIPELDVFLKRPILLRLVLDALPAIISEMEGEKKPEQRKFTESHRTLKGDEGEKEKEKEKEEKPKRASNQLIPARVPAKNKNKLDAVKRIQLTRQKLYTLAMQQWFKQQADKLRVQGIKDKDASIEEMLEKFTRDLALAFFQHRCNVLEWRSEEKEKGSTWSSLSPASVQEHTNPRWAKVFFDEKENPDIHWLIKGCPLHNVGSNRYAFLHKSLLEFFAAEHLFNGALLEGWVMSGRNLNVGNLQDEPQILSFLADRVKEDKAFEEVLFKMIETSKYEPSAWIGAANAITVLNRARVSLSRRNFRRVRLGGVEEAGKEWGADLSYAILSGTDLREADLRFVNLWRAWLEYANLSAACMDGVRFGERAYLQGYICAYSVDGNLLAVGSKKEGLFDINYYLSIYEGEEQRLIKRWQIKGQNGSVACLAFSPDSKQLASGSGDDTRLWEVKSGQCKTILEGHSSYVNSVAYRPDGKQLASGGWDTTIRLWEVGSGRCERVLEGHAAWVTSVSYRGDGKQLASGSEDKTIRLWEVESGRCERVLEGHTAPVKSMSYRGDGKQLASGSEDKTVRLWEVESGHCEQMLDGHTWQVNSVCYRADGKQLASGSWDKIRLWEVENGRCEQVLEAHTRIITSVIYRGDGKQLASGADGDTIRVGEAEAGRYEQVLEGHTEGHTAWVTSVSYRGDGKQLASGSEDKTIRLWEVESSRCERVLKGHTPTMVTSVSYRGDGKQLASGSADNTIRLWEVESGRFERKLEGHTNCVLSVSYRGDGKQLASGGHGYYEMIRLWEVESGRCERELEGHTLRVTSVSYRADGKQLASGSADNTIRLWEVESGRCERVLKGHTHMVRSVSYRGDGKQLASAGGRDKTIRLWEVESGKCKITLKKHTDEVSALAYHPNDAYLASSDESGTLALWDSHTYQTLAWLPHRHNGSLNCLAWSLAGDQLASGGKDGAVRVWRFSKEGNIFCLHLYWQTTLHNHLSSFSLNLTQVTGLSPGNLALLQQRGSIIGEPSQRESAKFLEERNAQIYIPSGRLDQPWLDNPQQGSFVITPKNWLVALVRKNTQNRGASKASGGSGQHVWLIVQGMTDDYYSVIKEIHFFLDSNKPTKYHNSMGTGLMQIRDKSPFDLEQQMKEGGLVAKVWGVSRDTVINKLLPAIEYDQTREIGYLITGRSAPLLFKAEAYSCLSWCVRHLQGLGLSVEPEVGWFDCIFAVPSHYLPATEAQINKKGKEKEKEQDVEPDTKCRIM